jgi:hypothetical protein
MFQLASNVFHKLKSRDNVRNPKSAYDDHELESKRSISPCSSTASSSVLSEPNYKSHSSSKSSKFRFRLRSKSRSSTNRCQSSDREEGDLQLALLNLCFFFSLCICFSMLSKVHHRSIKWRTWNRKYFFFSSHFFSIVITIKMQNMKKERKKKWFVNVGTIALNRISNSFFVSMCARS